MIKVNDGEKRSGNRVLIQVISVAQENHVLRRNTAFPRLLGRFPG